MHCVSLCILVSIVASCQALWPETRRKFDVIFVFEYQNRFKVAIDFVAENAHMVEDVHFGGIVFDSNVGVTIGLTGDKASFRNDVASIPIIGGIGRRLDLALEMARVLMNSGGRDDADKLVICMLTGPSDIPAETMRVAHNLRVAYIQVASLSAGNAPGLLDEMIEITSDDMRLLKYNTNGVIFDNMYDDQIGNIFQVAGICSACRWDNSIHYIPDPANCNAFFQCNGVDNYIRKFCSLDQLWDKELVQCIPAESTKCKDDPCRYHSQLEHYGDVLNRNCAYFWTCDGQRTTGYNCCIGNDTYSFTGDHVHVAPYAFWPPVYAPPPYPVGICRRLANNCTHDCPLVYPTFTPTITPTSEQCYPDIYLTFKPDVQGKGPNHAYIQNRGVVVQHQISQAVDDYAGYFGGRADLLSERFSHAWYGDYVEIFVRFMLSQNAANRLEMLVANGDCGEKHSIFIGFDRRPGNVIVKFNTTTNYAEAVVTDVQGYWIEVRVIYDGLAGDLTVRVTGIPNGGLPQVYPPSVTPLSGNVKQVLPALHVGGYTDASTNQYNNLNGWIDKFWIYTCRPNPYYPGTEP